MSDSLGTYWRRLAAGPPDSLPACLLPALLGVPALLYGLVQRLRSAAYGTGVLAVRRLPRPVVSVGNLTVGGTGKTPVTAHIGRLLIEEGRRVTVLSRGYGGSLEGSCAVVSDGTRLLLTPEECGDEPFLLASAVPGMAVVIGADRYRAGCLALEELDTDIFLLDDGFQHLALHRDLNILLLDAANPFGNGRTLPAGLLREPPSALLRADLIVLTRCDDGASSPLFPGKPTVRSRHVLVDAVPLAGGAAIPLEGLRGQRIVAFAGIADPDSFFTGLRACGLDLAATVTLPDHVPYTEKQLAEIRAAQAGAGASLLLTTEKDGVKLRGVAGRLGAEVLQVRLALTFADPGPLEAALWNLLHQ